MSTTDAAATALLGAWFCLACVFLVWGRYVGDEGWYCLISREVWRGRVLYGDVRFTQMPLLPYLYGAFLAVMPQRIESGRAISLALSLSGIAACYLAARRRYGSSAALAGLVVLTLHRAVAYDFTNAKTQALSFALVSWALWAAARWEDSQTGHGDGVGGGRNSGWLAAAGVLTGMAVLTRLSLAPLALLLPAFAACAAGERRPLRAALPAAAGALALPAAVFLGFLALCGDRFVFGIFGFHHAVASRFEIIPQLLEFARTAFVENTGLWTLVVVAGVVALGTGVVVGEMQPRIRPRAFEWLVALAWLSCTAIHAAARPAQRVYQMTLAWAPCLLGAWLWAAVAARFPRWRVALAGAYVVAAVAWMPWQDGWLHFRQPRTPAAVYEAASVLREGAPGDTLLTFDSGVAFCSPKTALLPGYEMSEFSMVLSSTPDIEAHMRGVSVAQFMDDLRTRARWIALRDLDIGRLAGATGDAIIGALGMYVPVKRVEHYGQLDEELIIARRRP